MARPLELEPYRLPSGRWQVNVIARLSPTGKRQRISFPSKQAALGYVEELKARRDNIAESTGHSLRRNCSTRRPHWICWWITH